MKSPRQRHEYVAAKYKAKLEHEDSLKYMFLLAQINRSFFNESTELPVTVTTKPLGDGTRETTIQITIVEQDKFMVKLDDILGRKVGIQYNW